MRKMLTRGLSQFNWSSKKGFRDTSENIAATVDRLALAISKLTGVEIQLPENDLVETAYVKLKKIFVTHYEAARNKPSGPEKWPEEPLK